jgi:hypothetical protein
MRQAIGPRMAGTVTADGVKLHTQDEVLPWGGFLAVKADERVVLLYLTRSEALPLHRTLFRSDADWSAFIEAARVGVPSKPRS